MKDKKQPRRDEVEVDSPKGEPVTVVEEDKPDPQARYRSDRFRKYVTGPAKPAGNN